MKPTWHFVRVAALALGVSHCFGSLTLERTIPLPGVEGRIDHFSLDPAGARLFVAALGNDTVEVVDLKQGKVVRSLTGFAEPQGVLFLPELNRLYVAGGGDGTLRILDGTTYATVKAVTVGGDADNLRPDPSGKMVYVGYGGGALGVVDGSTGEIIVRLPLDAHPESFQLEQAGPRIFVNLPGTHAVWVIDRKQSKVVAKWSTGLAAGNYPLALDEKHHRLFVACRLPARLLVFDTETGKESARLDLHGDCDDLFYDAAHNRLYASCGEGFIDIFDQASAGQLQLGESVSTAAKARTCLLAGEMLYLAVPHRGRQAAEVRCYRVGE
jgi:DNA-binding beta-propeller fold protein YncE